MTKRFNVGRDVIAGVFLLIAPLFPWNLYFGLAIPDSSGLVFALLIVVTVLALAAIGATYAGPGRISGSHFNPVLAGRLRVGLSAPYAVLVLGFLAFDVVHTVQYGGSPNVPGGMGPGAWLGIAGALLSAQPLLAGTAADDGRFARWLLSARIVGYASIALATLSFLFNLFWRIKAALPGSAGSSGFGEQNLAIIANAVVYGVVALIAVILASRWVVQRSTSSRLAIIALGASTLAAGIIVWAVPGGREMDAFHGIAQNTSTAGVGFEGYLAWAAAAAIFAPLTLLRVTTTHQIDKGIWRAAARKCLLLITVWCVASVVMRITDVAVSAALDLSRPPYDSAAMAAFDLVTAVLAIWLRINLVNRSLPVVVISSLCGVLFVLCASRIVIGIALAQRYAGTTAASAHPVYGNNSVQQITSTFDVVLCGLALGILAVTVRTARFVQQQPRTRAGDSKPVRSNVAPSAEPGTDRPAAGAAAPPAVSPRQRPSQSAGTHPGNDEPTRGLNVSAPSERATQQLAVGRPKTSGSNDPARRGPAPGPGRSAQPPPREMPKIYRPSETSAQRPDSGPTQRPDSGPTHRGRPPGPGGSPS